MNPQTVLSSDDIPTVLSLLTNALSQVPEQQKHAESLLSAFEIRAGFCSCLVEVIARPEHDHSARWLAATQLKNCIRHWRGRPDHGGITQEEKTHLRSRFSCLIPQQDNQIAVQIALVYAKVARTDYPREWPNLFQDLLSTLPQEGHKTANSTLVVKRVYLIFHHVLKELSSKRLAADQKTFAEITKLLLPFIWGQFCNDSQALISGIPQALEFNQAGQPLLTAFERWLLLLKILRRLILFGFTSDSKSLQPVPAVSECCPPMVELLQQLLNMRQAADAAATGPGKGTAARSHLLAMMGRGTLKLMKTQRLILESHPWSFHAAGVLTPMLSISYDVLAAAVRLHDSLQPHYPNSVITPQAQEGLIVSALLLIKTAVECPSYKAKTAAGSTANVYNEQDHPVLHLASSAQATLLSFLSADKLTSLCQLLVHLFMLNARDLEAWSEDAEAFYHSCDGSEWQDRANLCAENLFLTLLKGNRGLLCPVVVQQLQQCIQECPQSISNIETLPGGTLGGVPVVILRKDAVYNAVALAAFDLHDYIAWSTWLRGSLLQELSDRRPLLRSLRRRVMRIVAQWVADVEEQDRPALYEALLAAFNEKDDLCIQLSAVDTLRALVEDWNFKDEQFAPFVGTCMQQLSQILVHAHDLDTHTLAFNLMNLVIERMGDHIGPFVEPILRLLPDLWVQSKGRDLVRIQILLAMQRLVHVLGLFSPAAYPLVLPALAVSFDPSNPESLSLTEDGIALLLVLLRNAPGNLQEGADSPLLTLAPLLSAALSASTEWIQLGLSVLTSMVLLGGSLFLQKHGQHVLSIFMNLLGGVNERGMLLIYPAMEKILASTPEISVPLLQPALLKLLVLVLSGQESELSASHAMVVFARLMLISTPAFTTLFSDAVANNLLQQGGTHFTDPAHHLLSRFICVWVGGFDSLASTSGRKLCCLALCSLLSIPSPAVLQSLAEIVVCITGVWSETEGGADGCVRADYGLQYGWSGMDEGGNQTSTVAGLSEDADGELLRRKQASESDPVGRVLLSTALREALMRAQLAHGQAFETQLSSLDPAISGQLNIATAMKSA
ncbi:hypothetical protein CEUSTIGMA_g599.t1 [Chlamydomonas eustigma]|uniref:Importin N-terminal domain-containing protein n=1 Tax=Chlamydomonas eustigma TaxID=1157962 RepID=A0A250WR22_9CHLO|nr:hypothetical protein CEUSTIGMA_g599.t1 [Chlamydomonas eustigma]|eukprot:GAX73146.1 hypothetical protein CEUSTIGMA_g599.t1 [Chlamydomonas eustigma]